MSAVEYFPTKFPKWNEEAVSVVRYTHGDGVDVGCGSRALHSKMVRVDIDPDTKPDHVADATELPFADDSFDFMWSSHNLEHNFGPRDVIDEARRVVKPGGYLVFIVPDKRYTEGLDPTHKHEWTPEEFTARFATIAGLQLVAFGVGAKHWSFHAVYQVLKCAECLPNAILTGRIVEGGLASLRPRSLRRDPIRVSSIGDHPRLTTGLGQVHRMILSGFQKALFHISVLGCMETMPAARGEFPYYVEHCCIHDFFGYEAGPAFVHRTNPEVIFMNGDPGTLADRIQSMFVLGIAQRPLIVYFPIEGAPIAKGYLKMIGAVQESGGKAITYTEWGAERIAEQSDGELQVDWIHHGVDHAPFKPYTAEDRQHLRELIGWNDRFVVMNVSRNKRTNRHTAYIEAARILKKEGLSDILWYLHCDPLDRRAIQGMGGLDLKEMVAYYDVADVVLFPPDLGDQLHGPAFHRLRATGWQHLVKPSTSEGRGAMFASLSMIDRYNAADMYIDASSVQGFNLPNIEAMACGVPVCATGDGLRQEILGDAPLYLPSGATDYWHTGATLHLVEPKVIADAVLTLYHDHETRREMAAQSLERAKLFRWKPCQDKMVKAVKEVVLK